MAMKHVAISDEVLIIHFLVSSQSRIEEDDSLWVSFEIRFFLLRNEESLLFISVI